MIQCWRLDTPSQTMVLASFDRRLPAVVYWSAPLPGDEDLSALAAQTRLAPSGGMLDLVADVSVAPEQAGGFLGHPAIHSGGSAHQSIYELEAEDSAGGRLKLDYRDGPTGTLYRVVFAADAETDVIATHAELRPADERDFTIDWMAAPVLPAPQNAAEIIEFSGRWCGEFQTRRVPWSPGSRLRESWEGRTSHTDFCGILIPTHGASETGGEAFGFHLGWSGGHRMVAEELPTGQRQILFGALQDCSFTVKPDRPYTTPVLYVTRSDQGLGGVSRAYHAHLRRRILKFTDPARPRPVHYNCWEAVYFDHKPQVLMNLATRAADLGVERFVLDDGWFGERDDDTRSLGDWSVDRRKWPDGLAGLIDHVKGLGMTFGLWVEPEMVNEDSQLYRAHPDWMLGTGRYTGRNQQVLYLRKPEVSEFLFQQIDALLTEYDIDYLKWDHNRALPSIRPDQTEALYGLLARLRRAHPQVEIETCASGGGRVDFGILAHTQRFWASDSNDALERWKIQRGASYFFPPEITGAHVGPRVCHTSGRRLSMPFRAAVAGTRAMGLEMDLSELTDQEAAEAKAAIARFKARRGLLHTGHHYRLDSDDPAVIAEMHVAADGAEFALFAAQMTPSPQEMARPLRLAGLDPAARYRVSLENADQVTATVNRGPLPPLAAGAPVELSGQALMARGLQLPNAFPETMWTVNGAKL
ncbi:MAG: alpha-galactosidase [Pseudomonadota bacterium]